MSAHIRQNDESTDRRSHDEPRYSPYNWLEEDDGDEQDQDMQTGHVETSGTTKEGSLSRLVLKQTTDCLLDPIALNAPPAEGMHDWEGQVVELTDDGVFPPTRRSVYTDQTKMQKKAPSTEPWRYSEIGHLTFGGIIPDRSASELRQTIDLFFALVETRVPPSTKDDIRTEALRMKSEGDYHDTEIMEQVARWTFNPNELEDE